MPFESNDVTIDSPVNNFCLGNPLANKWASASVHSTYGWTDGHGGSKSTNISSIEIPPTGAWYFEILHPSDPQAPVFVLQQGTMAFGTYGSKNSGMEILSTDSIPLGGAYEWQSPRRTNNGEYPRTPAGEGIVGYYIDMENGTFALKCGSNIYDYSFTHNGWINFDKSKPIHLGMGNGGSAGRIYFNFGTNPTFDGGVTSTQSDVNGYGLFVHDPKSLNGVNASYVTPIPAKALCTKNIPSGPIDVHQDDIPSDYYKVLTWTGDGGGQRVIPHNMPKAPDLVWIKNRSSGGYGHTLFDSVRGYGANELQSSGTSLQGAYSGSYGYVDSVDDTNINTTDGTSAGYDDRAYTNYNGDNYVAWVWRAAGRPADGGSSVARSARIVNEDGTQADTTCDLLASNTGADIAPVKVSANRKSGFSIVLTTGIPRDSGHYTIPHGLTKTPELSIFKNLDYDDNWYTRHYATAGLLALNLTWGRTQYPTYWDDKPFDQNIFTVRGNSFQATSSDRLISYHFHSVAGYSKIGIYTGNGHPDGPYIECGFRVGWFMVKCIDNSIHTDHWAILDSVRDPHNVVRRKIYPNDSYAEDSDATYWGCDFLSSGVKIRNDWAASNEGNKRFIFMAFAENPFNAPATAR